MKQSTKYNSDNPLLANKGSVINGWELTEEELSIRIDSQVFLNMHQTKYSGK